MTDYNAIFNAARSASASRIADAIKTYVDGTPKDKKPDHNGAINASLIAEVTHLAAKMAVLESQLTTVIRDMNATGQQIALVVQHLTNK